MAESFPQALAPSTLNDYVGLARRCEAWSAPRGLDPWLEHTWTSFVFGLGVSANAAHQYLKTASAVLAFRERTSLQLASKQLRAEGALLPKHQAPAILRAQLEHAVLRSHRLPLLLAWKSASRWDEISKLIVPTSFIVMSPTEIIVDWLQETKASRTDPHRASRFTVLLGSDVEELYHLLSQHPPGPITSLSTSALTRLLRRAFPGENLSAHSLKAGAMDVLAAAVVAGHISISEMSRIAKHKTPSDPSATTLRYVRDLPTLARALATGRASALL